MYRFIDSSVHEGKVNVADYEGCRSTFPCCSNNPFTVLSASETCERPGTYCGFAPATTSPEFLSTTQVQMRSPVKIVCSS